MLHINRVNYLQPPRTRDCRSCAPPRPPGFAARFLPRVHPFCAWPAKEHGFGPGRTFNKVPIDGAGDPVAVWAQQPRQPPGRSPPGPGRFRPALILEYPPRMIRAFVALPLPEETRARLAVVQHLLPLPRRVEPENLHITLAFLGEHPPAQLEDLHDELSTLRQPGFGVAFAGLGTFGGDAPRLVHAAVAMSEPLTRLQRKVAQAARAVGITLKARRFMPHVTLARFRPEEADLARLAPAVAAGVGPLPGFTASRFALYRSDLTRHGPQYAELTSYPLGVPEG